MAQVPPDVCREIFLRLPSKSVIRFRAVCKSWLSIIDDPCFVRAHTNIQSNTTTILIRNSTSPPFSPLYTVDLETLKSTNGRHKIPATPLNFTRSGLSRITDLREVAACNGLLLTAPNGPAKNWEIWNPLTQERLVLPQQKFKPSIDGAGLGYDEANDDYKAVVLACESFLSKPPILLETQVYSLKSDSWRKIMDYPHGESTYGSPGVFLGGALHWISSSSSKDGLGKIIALDLGTESYRELKMPPFHKLNEFDYNEMPYQCEGLYVLSGCLAVTDAGEDDYFDLWVRMDYEADDSWTKMFKLSGFFGLCQSSYIDLSPVAYLKLESQVFLYEGKGFYLFDLESGSVKMVSIHGLCGKLSAQAFNGTIFRLHDNCGGGRRKRKITSTSKMKMADTELIFCVRDLSWSKHCCENAE